MSIRVEKFITDENENCFIEFIIEERKKKRFILWDVVESFISI